MDRERLLSYLERQYLPKRDVLSRIPLGASLDDVWRELLSRRRSRATLLPLRSPRGDPYWFVMTDSMIAASEKIVEEAMLPYENSDMAALEEAFYTSYVEGSQMTIEEAMAFVRSEGAPQDIQEQMLQNNRMAIVFALENVYHPITEDLIRNLAGILTAEMDGGGSTFRDTDTHAIPSMGFEPYTVPSPAAIPGMMRELCVYLADTNTHPLLKAAVAHAWFMVVRPFNEGNERLARLIAYMILLKAQYMFFNEVSLSALIAQDGYEYYGAVANLLREENGDDWTYLVDYYITLLGRAIDEIHQRRVDRDAEMGRQALGTAMTAPDPPTRQPTQPVAYSNGEMPATMEDHGRIVNEAVVAAEVPMEETHNASIVINTAVVGTKEAYPSHLNTERTGTAEEALIAAGFMPMGFADSVPDPELNRSDPNQSVLPLETNGGITIKEMRERLEEMANKPTAVFSLVARRLLEWMDRGKLTFDRMELGEGIAVDNKQSSNIIVYLRAKGIIVSKTIREDRTKLYALNICDNYEQPVISLIDELANAERSIIDRRIGGVLKKKLDQGCVKLDDYVSMGEEDKWQADMKFCVQLGLVTRQADDRYVINRELSPCYDRMEDWQRNFSSALYATFGRDSFTREMIVSTLDYSESTTKATLHVFTLMGILDRTRVDKVRGLPFTYQFRVTPEEHPECFRRAA